MTTPDWDFKGTMGLEDLYDEHSTNEMGDYNDLVVNYYMYKTPSEEDPDSTNSFLYEFVMVRNDADDAHSVGFKVPAWISNSSFTCSVAREVYVSQTGERTVSALGTSGTVTLIDNDQELGISSSSPVFVRVRITINSEVDHYWVNDSEWRPELVFTNLTTGVSFESGTLYTPPGGDVAKLQVLHIEEDTDFDLPVENGKMIEAYPGCADFMQNTQNTDTTWVAGKQSDKVVSLGEIPTDATENLDAYFERHGHVSDIPIDGNGDPIVEDFWGPGK